MKYIHFNTIPSTNTYLKENYKKHEHFTVVYANHQTQGKGRLGRTWTDSDDLLFSVLLKDNLKNFLNYSLLIAYSIMKVLKQIIKNRQVTIKWPNDIMIDDKKICGILLEGISKETIECVIIGCGVNVNSTVFPENIKVKATSLKNILEKSIAKEELLKKITEEFYKDYQEFNVNKSPYIDEINKNFYLNNKQVIFLYNNKNERGIVQGINNKGEIIIKTEKQILEISSGEITLESVYKTK